MNKSEINLEKGLSYDELCAYLQEKYGKPTGNYFLDESCSKPNLSIKRGKEGLEIHHIMEMGDGKEIVANISEKSQARFFPFEYQSADKLCYCNLLEHLLLHVKITTNRMKLVNALVYDGSLILIGELDDLYESGGITNPNYYEPIKDNYSEYIDICNILADVAEELNLN